MLRQPLEIELIAGSAGCILTHANVWSPDGEWIVYDTRSDAAGSVFDGSRIEMVHADSGETRILYESKNGACCGVASWHPTEMKVAFILGPEQPGREWSYGPSRRCGVIVDASRGGGAVNLDAQDFTLPGTPGALTGGSHLHIFHPVGDWISFTYEDDSKLRNMVVAVPGHVAVPASHPRNCDGHYYSHIVTRTIAEPRPGSDDISRACEEGWLGPTRSLAFQGRITTSAGEQFSEVFIVDSSDPASPNQRRLTFTEHRRFPGIQGPRHWLKSSPNGSRVGCLMKDDAGIVQLFIVTPDGGELRQLTRAAQGIGSAFTWSPCGNWIAAVADDCVAKIDTVTGAVLPLSTPSTEENEIRPEACVFSSDGTRIAYVRRRESKNRLYVISAE